MPCIVRVVRDILFSFTRTIGSASADEFNQHRVAMLVNKQRGCVPTVSRNKPPCMLHMLTAWLHPIARCIAHATRVNSSGHRGLRLAHKFEDGLCAWQVPVFHGEDGNACPAVLVAFCQWRRGTTATRGGPGQSLASGRQAVFLKLRHTLGTYACQYEVMET